MDRLTLVVPNSDIWLLDATGTPRTLVTKNNDTYKYTKRLAEYEDIGLLPEQIREVDRLYAEKCKELADLKKDYPSGWELAQIWAGLEQLKEYQHLEEQGKLPKLPCAVGDTVYTNKSIKGWYLRKGSRPYEAKVVFIGINGVDNFMNVDFGNGRMIQFKFSDIGETVFLTKNEAAEAVLKKVEESV